MWPDTRTQATLAYCDVPVQPVPTVSGEIGPTAPSSVVQPVTMNGKRWHQNLISSLFAFVLTIRTVAVNDTVP